MSPSLDKSISQLEADTARCNLRTKILASIQGECYRQESEWGNTSWPHYEREGIRKWKVRRASATRTVNRKAPDGSITWEDLLWEEFCEAMSETEWQCRRSELIQVAALIVAEIQDGDMKNPGG